MGKYSKLLGERDNQENSIVFKFIDGKYSGGEFTCYSNNSIKIGREITSDVALIDAKVSRSHAIIWNDGNSTYLKDLESTNGTFLNGESVAPHIDVVIKPGDRITIGDSIFEYKTKDPAPRQSYEMNEILLDDTDLENVVETSTKVNIATIKLEKQAVGAKIVEGTLSSVSLLDLLQKFDSPGIIYISVDKPFRDRFEISMNESKIIHARSIINPDFCEIKSLSRLLMSGEGKYKFQIAKDFNDAKENQSLRELVSEISVNKNDLERYKKLLQLNKLEILIPIRGKISELTKSELESLQFMLNTQEIMAYLDMFPDVDDFIVIAEVVKYIEKGILKGIPEEKQPSEDIIDF